MRISDDPDKLWQACKDELIERGFTINFQNRDAGIIETSPLQGKQWFEFWKKDIVDTGSIIKSSTQTTNRIVTITISNQENEQWIKCSVAVNRLYTTSLADAKLTRAENDYFASQSFLEKSKAPNMVWSPAGADEKLERAILMSIRKRLGYDYVVHVSY